MSAPINKLVNVRLCKCQLHYLLCTLVSDRAFHDTQHNNKKAALSILILISQVWCHYDDCN